MTTEELPPGYYVCIQKMLREAQAWLALRGSAGLSFTLPSEDVMLIGDLRGPIIDALAPGDVAREFLRLLDEATGGEGTAFQACFVVRVLKLPFVPGFTIPGTLAGFPMQRAKGGSS